MCRPHWFRLPPPLRRNVLNTYDQEQEKRLGSDRPSAAYMAAVNEAIAFIANEDGFIAAAAFHLARSQEWAERARETESDKLE